MAGATLCVSCAGLPLKDRSSAIKMMKCRECQTAFGVTSYGAAFRIQQAKGKRMLAPAFLSGMVVGAALFIFVVALTGVGLCPKNRRPGRPPPAATPAPNDLARVPEVAVDHRFPPDIQPAVAKQQ